VTGPIVGEWNGLEIAGAAPANDPRAGKRRMRAAVAAGTNFPVEDLRLEHALQTAMGRRRSAPPQFRFVARGIAAAWSRRRVSLPARLPRGSRSS